MGNPGSDGFPLSQAPVAPTDRGSASPGPSVYWFSQTIGPNRGLECAVRASARAKSRPHLYLRGTTAAGFADAIRGLAEREGVDGHVHLLPPDVPQEMARLAAQYDVGLAGEIGNRPNRRMALTNKQFTYLLGGVPVVMSDMPAHAEFAKGLFSAARLYRSEDPASLAETLDSLLLEPAELAQIRETAFQLDQTRFNWEVAKEAIVGKVASALGVDARVSSNAKLGRRAWA